MRGMHGWMDGGMMCIVYKQVDKASAIGISVGAKFVQGDSPFELG
jgi:hypothetical protein